MWKNRNVLNPASQPSSPTLYYCVLGSIVLTILLAIPLLKNNYLNHVVTEMLLLAYLAQAWNIMSGYTGQLSFGHAGFFGIGVYTSSILFTRFGITPWVGMFVGGSLALIAGTGVGMVSFRYGLRGVYFSFVTLAFAEILGLLCLLWKPLTGGAEGILLPWKGHNPLVFAFDVDRKYLYYYTMLLMSLCCTFLAYKIKKVRLGYYLAAIRENEDAAEMIGIDGQRYKLVAIAISAFLTALGGTFYVQYYQHVEPELAFGVVRSFEMIYPVIIGGGSSVFGPPLGAFFLQFFEEVFRATMPATIHGLHRMVYGVLVIFIIMYLPGGLVGFFQSCKQWLLPQFIPIKKVDRITNADSETYGS
jgi:branched-chain amino acid transport system permease protein